mmetsp:Transcript_128350/g.221707  ORF Transcript_128350/g.221707 Transcript_128350/m.221707 type:complete len:99 (+) Transcript_128350:651-947(+)
MRGGGSMQVDATFTNAGMDILGYWRSQKVVRVELVGHVATSIGLSQDPSDTINRLAGYWFTLEGRWWGMQAKVWFGWTWDNHGAKGRNQPKPPSHEQK